MPRADLNRLIHVAVLVDTAILAPIVLTEVTEVAGIAGTEAALARAALVAVGQDGAVGAFEAYVANARAVVGASALAAAAIEAQGRVARRASPPGIAHTRSISLADAVLRAVAGARQSAAVASLPAYQTAARAICAHAVARAAVGARHLERLLPGGLLTAVSSSSASIARARAVDAHTPLRAVVEARNRWPCAVLRYEGVSIARTREIPI